jgi:amino acid permease
VLLGINEYFLLLISGALIAPIISFVLPVIFYYKVFSEDKTYSKKIIFNWVMLALSVVFNVISIVYLITHPISA